ncbi:hypothetical protein F1D05_01150 [Kribbella qitaiheensis]|uniref:Uncharacterized protein n=1 Tax=Kribbella qitaiheensis TaxID=1544730 RepID=A0A7G6WRZ3_9ACTN|nr:hypothetical protein [Kribbella qitaiheensis]QNE16758.1 hypothetical protein F1D05_01150 [Kribbella qitaiheensis]
MTSTAVDFEAIKDKQRAGRAGVRDGLEVGAATRGCPAGHLVGYRGASRRAVRGPVEWVTLTKRDFVFRCRSAEHFSERFGQFYGPITKLTGTLSEEDRAQFAAQLADVPLQSTTAPTRRWRRMPSTSGRGAMTSIRLMGPPVIEPGQGPARVPRRRKTWALRAYLLARFGFTTVAEAGEQLRDGLPLRAELSVTAFLARKRHERVATVGCQPQWQGLAGRLSAQANSSGGRMRWCRGG